MGVVIEARIKYLGDRDPSEPDLGHFCHMECDTSPRDVGKPAC